VNANEVPRIAAPLLLAAAILLSAPHRAATPPVELPPGEAPMPSLAETLGAFEQALAPGAPGYDRGSTRAAVTVIEFADFGCRYCARFAAETYPALAGEFVRTGKVRWRYVPFVLGMFTNGDEAARAGTCAAEQGPAAFGRMHDRLFADQSAWAGAGDAASAFAALARGEGLDVARFASCFGSAAAAARVSAANSLAERMAVRSTPTFFVNGTRVEGALPAEQFRSVLLDALEQSHRH
jgi:protein-disulfide isomerase